MDNRKGTSHSEQDRDRQNPTQGSNPGRGHGHNPHHSAIGEPGSRRRPGEPTQKRNEETDIDDDLMDEDRDEDQDSRS